jgi:hypothetical protein
MGEPGSLLLSRTERSPAFQSMLERTHACKGCITDMHNPWIVKTFVPREGRLGAPGVSKAPQKEPRNLVAFVIQSFASDIDEPEVPLHSPHQ